MVLAGLGDDSIDGDAGGHGGSGAAPWGEEQREEGEEKYRGGVRGAGELDVLVLSLQGEQRRGPGRRASHGSDSAAWCAREQREERDGDRFAGNPLPILFPSPIGPWLFLLKLQQPFIDFIRVLKQFRKIRENSWSFPITCRSTTKIGVAK